MRRRLSSVTGSILLLIYVLVFISSIAQLRFRYSHTKLWESVYFFSTYLIVFFDLAVIILSMERLRFCTQRNISIPLLLFAVYALFVSIDRLEHFGSMIRNILPWPLTFIAYYSFSRKNKLPKLFKQVSAIGTAICCIFSLPNISRHLTDYGNKGEVIFPVYYCVVFLGLVLIMNTHITQYCFMGLVLVLLTISTKRAGTIMVAGGIALYYFVGAIIQKHGMKRRKRLLIYLLIIVFATVVGLMLIEKYDIKTLERISNIQNDGGSNRIYIWRDVLKHYSNSDSINKIFGHGFHAVYYDVYPYGVQRMAHNSLLEILYDYGIVGLALILWFMVFLIWKTIELTKKRNKYAPALAYSMVVMIVMSMVSYFFEQSLIILPCSILWGIILGSEKTTKQHNGQFACREAVYYS